MNATQAYTTAVGRRKTATARVKVTPVGDASKSPTGGKTSITVNGKPADEYFKTNERRSVPKEVFHVEGVEGNFEVVAKVMGGGVTAQADAVRMAIARAIEKRSPNLRKPLKAAGYLKRDPRSVERKKPGLKKARKAPQWSKR